MNLKYIIASLRGLAGGLIGGAAGYFLFFWLRSHYGRIGWPIPGALLGLGWGLASRHRSFVDGTFAAVLALFLGLLTAWNSVELRGHESWVQFLAHLPQLLTRETLILLGLGVVIAFWFGVGRQARAGKEVQ